MKKIFLLTSVFAGLGLQAQDTLYTVSGQKILAKVLEIDQTEIKYKKTNNLDGPVYIVEKTDIALIEYKNGTKEIYGNGSNAQNGNDQTIANNNDDMLPQSRYNVIIGNGWTWSWPLFNTWSFWGGYRVYPRIRHLHHYYKPYHHHHKWHYYGRRGR